MARRTRRSPPRPSSRDGDSASEGNDNEEHLRAALLASCASPLSVGTDVGGSIRIPAVCSGVLGHKPSPGWVPLDGAGLFDDKLKKSRVLVAGPLGRYMKDLSLALQVLAPQDATGLTHKISSVQLPKVKVWWAQDLGSPLFAPLDSRLENLLHSVIQFLDRSNVASIDKWPLDMSMSYKIWNNKMADDYKGDPSITVDITDRKGEVNLFKEWYLFVSGRGRHTFPILGQATIKQFVKGKPEPKDSKFYWKTYKEKFMKVLGNDGVLIMPVLPIVSPYHNEPIFNPFDFCFCALFNAIEFPSTAVALGSASDGSPLGLQVVTTPGNDHLSLAVAAALEERFGDWVPTANSRSTFSLRKDL